MGYWTYHSCRKMPTSPASFGLRMTYDKIRCIVLSYLRFGALSHSVPVLFPQCFLFTFGSETPNLLVVGPYCI